VVSITLSDNEAARRAARLVASLSDKDPIVDHNTVELTVEDGPKVGADVLRTLDAAQVPIAGLALREPSLDDVFLSLTGHKSEAETEAERAARLRKGGAKRRGPDAHADSDGNSGANANANADADADADSDADGRDAA